MINDQNLVYGVVGMASADDRILGLMLLTVDPENDTDQDDYVLLLSAAARHALAG